MIDNFKLILDNLSFETEDDFYYLQIIKRKKENPELGSNNSIIQTYYIKSQEHLQTLKPNIINLCEFNNARAYINLNKRSFEKLAFQTLKKVTDQILAKDYKNIKTAYNSVCGMYSNDSNKKWIIDLDTKNEGFHPQLLEELYYLEPLGNKYVATIPTKSGFHLIVKPFNKSEFHKLMNNWNSLEIADIHKDNPTILYIK